MKKRTYFIGVALVLSTFGLWTQTSQSGVKSCEELKGEIEAKLKAKGVKGYTLEVIPADQAKDQKIIGTCEGGKKRITYSRK